MSLLRRLALAAAALLAPLAARANVPALGAAVDAPALVWTTGGATSWTAQAAVTHDGVDAARATGLSTADSETWIETTVTAPGVLSWRWHLVLDEGSDSVLELSVGPETSPRASLYSSDDFTASSLVLDGSGPVALRWRLRRLADAPPTVLDGPPAPSDDAAYLDTVAYAPFGPLVLQAHTGLTARGFTANWTALPAATAYSLELATSADFSGSTSTSAIEAPATSFAIEGLEPGVTYHYRLVAQGPEAISATSAPRSVTTPPITRPANDAFAAAATLGGIAGSTPANPLDATLEASEPGSHEASIWFKWTAPSAGLWRFRTAATTATPPSLFIYTGSAIGELDFVASGSLDAETGAPAAEFEAAAGVTYRIALDASPAAQTATTLSWERLVAYTPPGNDSFASPTSLSGNTGTIDATNVRATAEPGESASARHSVWFSWRAPASGLWSLTTTGSAISTTLSVWSGSSLSSLVLIASDSAAAPSSSQVSLSVTKDVLYRVSLDGLDSAQGALRLAWSLAVPTVVQTITPPELTDLPIDTPPFTLGAFADSGLPLTYAVISGPASLDGDVLSLTGQPGTVKIRATQPGDATYLAVSLDFNLLVHAPPANDRATAATRLATNTGALDADLRFATTDSTDVYPARRSVWFRWTATANGILTLDTATSPSPVTLEIHTGPVTGLTSVDASLASDQRPRLEVPLRAGLDYFIVLDTRADPAGLARLAWSFAAPSTDQTIEFASLPDLGRSSGPVFLEATASSGLPVVFSLVSGPATLSGDTLRLTGQAGDVTVRASQPGDHLYKPAPSVDVSFKVRAPPGNDNAAAATVINGASGSVTGSNIDATSELLDPAPGNHSVWWRWNAPSTGLWTVDTTGSIPAVALTLLRGSTPATLELLGSDLPSAGQGSLAIPVYAGTSYWIVLDSPDGSQGALKLSWTLTPPALSQTIIFDQELPDLVVGDAAPALSFYATSSLPVTLVVSGPARLEGDTLVLTGQAGTVTLRATQLGDATYQSAPPVTRTFIVAPPPPLTITFSDLRQTYDGSPLGVTATASATPRVGDVVVTYNGSTNLPTQAGTYTVVATADTSRATAKFVIDKRPLVVTADDQRKLAGQENPPLTFDYSGFAPGKDATDLLRAPIATTTARASSPGRTYPIKVSGGQSPNYTFTYVPGILTVDTLAGRYEALLFDGSAVPAGKLELTVAASGKAFTGKLTLARETAVLSVKGNLALDAAFDLGSATLPLTGAFGAYTLSFDVQLDGRFFVILDLDGGRFATSFTGRRVFVPPSKPKLPWAGAHTALLAPTAESPSLAPAGSGHATASIDAKGNLKLSGRLADTTAFTATLAPDADGGYRLFAKPYVKRRDSYLGGEFALADHPDTARFPGRRHLPGSAGVTLSWAKAAATADKAYAAGFGPLAVPFTLAPWARPAAPLAIALDVGPAGLDFGARAAALPISGVISTAGAFTLTAPLTTPANQTKFSLKLTPATGAFTGSFTLSDQILPAPAKPETRTVKFTGVLLTPSEAAPSSGATLGAGHFLLSPLSSDESETGPLSGEILLRQP